MKISSASKKVLASALSAAMVVAFAPTAAFAAGVKIGEEVPGVTYVASVVKANGDTYKYTTLKEATTAAVAGDTINLLEDIYLADAVPAEEIAATDLSAYYLAESSGVDGHPNYVKATGEWTNSSEQQAATYYSVVATLCKSTDKIQNGTYYYKKNATTGALTVITSGLTPGESAEGLYTVAATTADKSKFVLAGTSGMVTAATAAKYENLKTEYSGNGTYETAASINGNGHKIVIENVANENYGTVKVPNITENTVLTVTNTVRATVKDLAIEDNTDGDAKAAGKQTTIGGVATAVLDDRAAADTAQTSTGTTIAGLTVTGLTISNIVAKGSVDVSATADSLATAAKAGAVDTAVKVAGGTFKTVEGHTANVLTVAGGTISGKIAELAKAPAGTKAADAKLAKPAANGATVTVESWADESKRTYYSDTYTAAVYQAVIAGGTIDGYVSSSKIKGGTFKLDPTEVFVSGSTTDKSNTVAANYVYANGTVDKGIQASQIAGLNAFKVKTDSDASYNTVTGVKTEAVTATADTNKAIVAAATAAVKGLATTDKLYKAMYVTGGGADATITIAKQNSDAYVSADRVAALTEDQKAANAIVEGALATSGSANMAGVLGITVDAKTGKITNGSVEKVSATISAGAANTVKNGAVELADFGAIYASIDLGNKDPEYTGMALLFSADGKTWSVAQSGLKVYKSTGTNGLTNGNYYVDAAYDKAGYYALAYTNAANDAKVKAEEEAKKAAEEAAAKLVATQDASAIKDVKGASKTVKLGAKKSKTAASKTVTLKSVVSESGATVAYKKASSTSMITVKGNKVTLKKGAKKGKTYSVKVKATIGASAKTVTVKFVIK